MIPTKKQKKESVIKLLNEGKTTREIAKEVKISLRDISAITREINREPEPKPTKSSQVRAYDLFSKGKTPIQVSIILNLEFDRVNKFYSEFLSLRSKAKFIRLFEENETFLSFIDEVLRKMRLYLFTENDVDVLLNILRDFNIENLENWDQIKVNLLKATLMRLKNETIEKTQSF